MATPSKTRVLPWVLGSVGFFVFLLPLVLRLFVIEAFRIPAGSMIPTVRVGDHIFISKLGRTFGRGDVVVFRFPKDRDKDFIKRIVAVAGDTIAIEPGGSLTLNGAPVARTAAGSWEYDDVGGEGSWEKRVCLDYIEKLDSHEFHVCHEPDSSARFHEPVSVPAGHVYVLGDNRENSHDSRYWGFVPVEDIKGRMVSVWWHAAPPPKQ
jgi:signal peptidase I